MSEEVVYDDTAYLIRVVGYLLTKMGGTAVIDETKFQDLAGNFEVIESGPNESIISFTVTEDDDESTD